MAVCTKIAEHVTDVILTPPQKKNAEEKIGNRNLSGMARMAGTSVEFLPYCRPLLHVGSQSESHAVVAGQTKELDTWINVAACMVMMWKAC